MTRILLALALLGAGCDTENACHRGEVGCPCKPDGTCLGKMECFHGNGWNTPGGWYCSAPVLLRCDGPDGGAR